MLGYLPGSRLAAEAMPTSITKQRIDDLDAMTADALFLDDLPADTIALARLLECAAAGSMAVLEFNESIRRASEWKEVFQALGFKVLKMGRRSGRLIATLYKPVHPASLRRWSVILPHSGSANTFARLYDWIAFFQRFDSIGEAEIILVEDDPLEGNVKMLNSIASEGFFLRKRHYRPAGLMHSLATGIHFSSGRKIILDADPRIQPMESLSLLEASYPLDYDRLAYFVIGNPTDGQTDLREAHARRRRRFFSSLFAKSESRFTFSLLTGEGARSGMPSRNSLARSVRGLKTIQVPVTITSPALAQQS